MALCCNVESISCASRASHSSELVLGGTYDYATGAYDPSRPSDDPWRRRAELLVCEILGTDPLCEGVLRCAEVSNAAEASGEGVAMEATCELRSAVPSREHQRRLVAAVEGGLRGEVERALRAFAAELAQKGFGK